jgi:sigma-54 specific flagellar transcriptional regulator A
LPAVNSPPCPASSHPTALDVEDSDTESDGPLPQIEANATAVAYAQVRQGCVTLSDMKRQIERDCIARALAETKGNITRAATLLGMKRPRLSQLVKQYGLAAVSSEA